MKAAKTIRKRIEDQGPDSLWAFADFLGLPQHAVAKALSRLAKAGMLQRIRKGLYYYPKTTVLGPSRPATGALLEKALMGGQGTGVYSGGTASFQNLGITTQVPAYYTLLGDRASRKIRVGTVTARIRRRSFNPASGVSQQDVWVLDAIRNLKHVPDSTPTDAVTKIMNSLQGGKRPMKTLLRTAYGEPPRVRAVLGAIAEQIGYQGPEVRGLKNSLNPLTKFRLGIGPALPNAASWGIV